MKKLILLFAAFLFLQFNSLAQEGWLNITPQNPPDAYLGLYAVDANDLWVVGKEGTIIHTTNSGTDWIAISCPVNYSLQNVHFINADTGWVGGDHESITEVLRTTNRGLSWETQSLSTVSDEGNHDIEFIEGGAGEPVRGFVTAGLSLAWRTDDYGENWLTLPIGGCGSGDLESICFINKEEGWFVGTPSAMQDVTIVHTTDGGETFEVQTNPTNPDIKLNCVSFANSQRGIAVGNAGTILYTSDGGTNWEIRPSGVGSKMLTSVCLLPSGKAWAVGNSGVIIYSTDWGYTWVPQQSGTADILWEVTFINDNEGWIAGGMIYSGIILHTTNGGVITGVDENEIVRQFELLQNYPNPFNPTTRIQYQIPELGSVTLKIFDVLGNEVATLVDEEKPDGTYETEFSAEGLSSGIYLYRLQAGSFVETKKMILLR